MFKIIVFSVFVNLVTSIPSIETYNNIINKKYFITKLNKRYNLVVKNIYKWNGPTGIEIEFKKI